jgi:hypothetical protein
MKRTGLVLLSIILAGQAHAQTAVAPAPTSLACGNLKGESSRTAATSQWTISGPSGKTTETGVLRGGPRFECVNGAILVVETTSTAGHSVFVAYFPDGSDISYGRQQVDRRGNRWILPIQAKTRIAAPFRSAFDYHCKLSMPADPIDPATRMDCVK